ncbi:hypothetical protein [Xanthomonas citri]|uniref:hypothetical protein n=1 Tax=Xanthomonas citri TaxID=346 RepID=UPI0012FEEA2E|nr:hypothetical protein [Xanthomonas citri]
MHYYDACEWIVTRAEAKAEIDKHDCDGGFAAFMAEVGVPSRKGFFVRQAIGAWRCEHR